MHPWDQLEFEVLRDRAARARRRRNRAELAKAFLVTFLSIGVGGSAIAGGIYLVGTSDHLPFMKPSTTPAKQAAARFEFIDAGSINISPNTSLTWANNKHAFIASNDMRINGDLYVGDRLIAAPSRGSLTTAAEGTATVTVEPGSMCTCSVVGDAKAACAVNMAGSTLVLSTYPPGRTVNWMCLR